MIAEFAGKLVAPFIDKQWPEDSDEIFQILRLGVNKAWQEGKWKVMTAEFFVNINEDGNNRYVIGPPSHPILLACNVNNKPVTMRDEYFMFHKNGSGDIRSNKNCSWNTYDVYDTGPVPTIPNSNKDLLKGFRVGIRALGDAGLNEKVYINGKYSDGNQIYTYEFSKYGDPCACDVDESKVDTVNGIALSISNKFNYVPNITFDSITSIHKTVTRTPVEVIAIDCMGNGHMIARLEPNQTTSEYRKYSVPNIACKYNQLHGLFKIAQQGEIKHPSDNIIVSNEEALICFAKGIHQMYWKEQQEQGAYYIMQGIGILEKELREERTATEFPIQVSGINYEDLPDALRYHH